MNFLDMRTVIFSQLLTAFVCAWVIAGLWRQNRSRLAGAPYWLSFFVLQATATLLIGLRGAIPDWISIVLANTLAIAGALLAYMGLERFVRQTSSQVHNYLLLAAFVLVYSYFTFIQPDLAARTIAFSLGLLIICAQCAWLMLRRIEAGMRPLTREVGYVFGGFCLVSLARIIAALAGRQPNNDFLKAGAADALSLLAYEILLILLTYSLALMMNRRLLAEAQAQEEKFSTVFRSSPNALALTALSDGRILEVNDGFVSLIGYPPAEIIGQTALDLQLWAREEDRAAVGEALSQRRPVREVEYQFRKKSGELLTGLFSAETITIEGQPCLLSSIGDITERIQAEEALRSERAMLARTESIAHVGSWEWVVATDTTIWSEELFRIFQRDPAEGALSFAEHPAIYDAEDMQRITAAVEAAVTQGIPYELEIRPLLKDGARRVCLARGQAEMGPDGRAARLFGSFQDITEYKETEKAWRESEARFREMFDHMSSGVAVYEVVGDGEGFVFKDMNRAGQRIEDVKKEEIVGKDVREVFSGVVAFGLFDVFKRVWKTGQPEHFAESFYQDGRVAGWKENYVCKLPSGEIVAIYDDVTEQKKTEDALASAHERLILAQRSAGAGLWDWDMPSGRLTWSDEQFRIFGLDPAVDAAAFDTWRAALHPEDRHAAEERINAAVRERVPLFNEYRIVLPAGEVRWIQALGDTTYDADGKALRMAGICIDVTERKRAQEALRESEARYRMLAENIQDVIWILDAETLRFRYVSPSVQRLRGYTVEEVMAEPMDAALVPAERAWLRALIQQGVAELLAGRMAPGAYYVNEMGLPCKDGSTVWTELVTNYQINPQSGKVEVLGVTRDISARKRAEEALRERENMFEKIFEILPIGLWLADGSGKLLRGNPAGKRIWGAEPLVDQSEYGVFKSRRLPSGEELAPADWALARTVNERVTVLDELLEIDAFDGQKRVILNYTAPVLDAAGRVEAAVIVNLDITERTRAEQAQRGSEERFHAITEQLTDVVYVTDAQGVITYLSSACRSIFGLEPEAACGRHFIELLSPDDIEPALSAFRDAIERGVGSEDLELRMKRADGSLFFGELGSTILRMGDSVGTAGVIRDITERKRAEADLLMRLRQQAAIAEVSQVALTCEDLQELFDLTVRRLAETVGVEYCKVLELLSDGSALLLRAGVGWQAGLVGQALVDAGPDSHSGFTLRSKEPVIVADLRVEPRFAGPPLLREHGVVSGMSVIIGQPTAPFGVLGLHTQAARAFTEDDVRFVQAVANILAETIQRKRAEAALQESEEKHRLILENSGLGVGYYDLDGKVLLFNRMAARNLGGQPEDFVGKSFYDLYGQDIGDQLARRIRLAAQSGESQEYEDCSDLANGATWFSSRFARVSDAGGRVIGVQIISNDISERKREEQEKEKLQSQLLHSQKMESVGRLAGGVAHDFNNMLQAILGYADMGLRQAEPAGPMRDYFEQIRKAANRSADLTRQLLAFARRQTIQPVILDVNDAVAGALKMLRRLIGEDIHLAWLPGPNLWKARMDPAQIDQILANLTVNARDAIAGVGKITIETANVALDAAYAQAHLGAEPGDYVQLTITDTGCGMDKEVMEHIFEPFFTTKGLGKGTGLGLATVFGIVKQNNGLIYAYSEPGQGTTFNIYLPRFQTAAEEAAGAPVAEKAPARGVETILIVEDEAAILELGKRMLEALGYSVLTAGSPQEALRLVAERAGQIHLLISDVVMPEMDGRQLAQRLTTLRPGLRCVFMSGYPAEVIAHRGALDEGVRFVEKPFTVQSLAEAVRRALDEA